MEYKLWTAKLKKLRLSRGLRQEDVAKLMRLSRSQYSAIENGKSVVNYHHLMSLALVLKVSIQSLIAMTLKASKTEPSEKRVVLSKKPTKTKTKTKKNATP